MNPATVALIILVVAVLLWILLIIAPWGIEKVVPFLKLKKWVKHLLSIFYGFIGAGVVLLLFLSWATISFFNLSRNSKYARLFLEDCGINVDLPKFKVKDHTFRFIGGDDTEIRWEVKFKKPLSDEFVATLDSLCRHYSSGWSFNKQDQSYVYSYWHPDDIEIKDCVVITPMTQSATFIHTKI